MSGFNPYREWLGLETDDRPTYCELMGLARDASALGQPLNGLEREHVQVAAARQLQQLQRLDPGPHGDLRDQLARRLERARTTLSDEKLRRDYDRRLLQEEAATLARKQIPQPAPGGDHRPMVTTPTETDDPPDRSPLWQPARPRVVMGRNLRRQKRRQRVRVSMALLLVVSLIGLAYLAVAQREQWMASQPPPQNSPPAEAPKAPSRATPNEPDTPTPSSPTITPAPPAVTRTPASPPAERTIKTTPSPQAATEPTAQQEQARERLWHTAIEQLDAGRYAESRASLEQSSALPMSEADRQRQARLTRLVDYVQRYWSAADRSLASLKSGDEFELQDKRVIVVERSDSRLVLRSEGRNIQYDLDSLPPEMARLFAERWFDQQAASTLVFRGAMMAVGARTEAERGAVRDLWKRAVASGEVEVGDLPLVLDDLEALRRP